MANPRTDERKDESSLERLRFESGHLVESGHLDRTGFWEANLPADPPRVPPRFTSAVSELSSIGPLIELTKSKQKRETATPCSGVRGGDHNLISPPIRIRIRVV